MRKILLFGIFLLGALLTGCNKVTVTSNWNNGQIKIDAAVKDWGPRLVWNEKNRTGLGIANDTENLYLCLTTSEKSLPRQIMRGGLIVRIDQKGAKSHNFGVKFPLGLSSRDFQGLEPPENMDENSRWEINGQNRPQPHMRRPEGMLDRRQADQENQQNAFMERLNDLHTELMLLGPGKGQETIVPLENDLGLEVKLGRDRQQLVYELKIPFDLISEYLQIEQIPFDKSLQINFSTVEVEMPAGGPGSMGRPDGDMSGSGGGMGGPGGNMGGPDGGMGGPGGGMGRPGGGEDNSDQSFSYNIKVNLAIKP